MTTQNLSQALRRLRQAPGFTLTAVLTLGVGIAANTAIFSVVKGVLLEPLPFEEPEQLVSIQFEAPGLDFEQLPTSPATYLTQRADARTLAEVAIWNRGSAQVLVGTEPEQVPTLMVTDGFLPTLRVNAALGRRFSAEDDAPGAPDRVMLSHRYWQSAFGGDPGVVGRSLTVYGEPREIIGVLPAGFDFLEEDPAFLFPAQFDPSEVFFGNFSYQSVARMRPDVTVDRVHEELGSLTSVAVERYPGPVSQAMVDEVGIAPLVVPLKDELVGDVSSVLWILLGTVGIVLLIAIANVSNLFLVRAEGRATDLAVRTAMGAERRAIAAHFLSESLLLGLIGGVVGLGLAAGALRLLLSMASVHLPRLDQITIDPVVLAFTLVLSVGAGVAFGLLPLVHYGRPNLVTSLKEGGRGGSEGRVRRRARNALVVGQVALALVLVVASGLMVRSFQALRSVDPGFRTADALTFRLTIPSSVAPDQGATVETWRQIQEALGSVPGVSAVGVASSIPLTGYESMDPLWVDGEVFSESQVPPVRRFNWVLPGYFTALGIPLLAGRDIGWPDIERTRAVAVVSEGLAREYFDEPERAIGRTVATIALEGGPMTWNEIIGVVGDVHQDGFDQDVTSAVYWPMAQQNLYGNGEVDFRRTMGVAVAGGPGATSGLLEASRRAVAGVSGSLPIAQPRTMQELVRSSMARASFALVMLGIAAGVALLLGAIGIYGVISYAVSQRTREIGLRMALGADRSTVSGMVVRQGMTLVGIGVGLGLLAAVGLTRVMASLLFGVDPVDVPTFSAVSAGLAAVALGASWLPASRATRIDPATALRKD